MGELAGQAAAEVAKLAGLSAEQQSEAAGKATAMAGKADGATPVDVGLDAGEVAAKAAQAKGASAEEQIKVAGEAAADAAKTAGGTILEQAASAGQAAAAAAKEAAKFLNNKLLLLAKQLPMQPKQQELLVRSRQQWLEVQPLMPRLLQVLNWSHKFRQQDPPPKKLP